MITLIIICSGIFVLTLTCLLLKSKKGKYNYMLNTSKESRLALEAETDDIATFEAHVDKMTDDEFDMFLWFPKQNKTELSSEFLASEGISFENVDLESLQNEKLIYVSGNGLIIISQKLSDNLSGYLNIRDL